MSVKKIEGKTGKCWRCDVSLGRGYDGKQVRVKKYFRTKAEALSYEQMLHIQNENNLLCKGSYRLADFIEEVYWPQKTLLKISTKDGYQKAINASILPALGNMNIGDIKHSDIQNMLSSEIYCKTRKRGMKAKTVLSSIMGVAIDAGFITKNPVKSNSSQEFLYRDDEVLGSRDSGEILYDFTQHMKFLQWLKLNHRNDAIERMLAIGLSFGLRKGEILGLDWEDIDFDKRTIRIKQTYTAALGTTSLTSPKTLKSKRTLPMNDWIYERLSEWSTLSKPAAKDKDGNEVHPIVWGFDREGIHRQRMNPDTATNKVNKALKGKTYPDGTRVPQVTLFSCRHSFATACLSAGMNVREVADMLGHTNVEMLWQHYLKLKGDWMPQYARMMSDAMKACS